MDGTIEVSQLSKHFGPVKAVDNLSFTVHPGRVTGFLGPNGAGKSTTMRVILGLDRPNNGTATIGGRAYRDLPAPLRVVGALLEAKAVHSGRSAYNHLLVLAQTQDLPRRRVDEVIELIGLTEVARKRAGNFSLGMGQRLGLAAALLGDPQVLVLDEPVNGLDPEGIRWIRGLMKHLASQGRTVFVSSHLMNEMSVTADHLVVIGRGRLIADCPTDEFIARSSEKSVLVKSPDSVRLGELIGAAGGRVQAADDGGLSVSNLAAPRIGELAAREGFVLHELTPQLPSLEEAFMELTRDSVQFSGRTEAADPAAPARTAEGAPR
ncbi:MAG: ATP-binding cassette domain-containing protein [Pseudonocardiales bacterium]